MHSVYAVYSAPHHHRVADDDIATDAHQGRRRPMLLPLLLLQCSQTALHEQWAHACMQLPSHRRRSSQGERGELCKCLATFYAQPDRTVPQIVHPPTQQDRRGTHATLRCHLQVSWARSKPYTFFSLCWFHVVPAGSMWFHFMWLHACSMPRPLSVLVAPCRSLFRRSLVVPCSGLIPCCSLSCGVQHTAYLCMFAGMFPEFRPNPLCCAEGARSILSARISEIRDPALGKHGAVRKPRRQARTPAIPSAA
jgi:hypothetical protein